MPCRSDYLEPNQREQLLQETAQLYAYALHEAGDSVPQRVSQAARDIYCSDDYVSHLCDYLTRMPIDVRHRIVYNAYDPESRRLADWWERHQLADQQRQAREQEALLQSQALARALSKLDDQELAALRRHFAS